MILYPTKTYILEVNLISSTKKLNMERRWKFQQDNGPTHTAKITQKVLAHPRQLSDFNPIENLRRDFKLRVH